MLTLIFWVSFLSFGLFLSLQLLKLKAIPKEFLYISSLAVSLLLWCAGYFIYLVSPYVGEIFTYAFIASSILVLIPLNIRSILTDKKLKKAVLGFFIVPLFITAVLFSLYSASFYSCTEEPSFSGYGEVQNRTFCQISTMPFDNALPFIYADNILENKDTKKALSWTPVDRPPLQIATSLPINDMSEGDSRYSRFFQYHLFSVFLQLSWVGTVWGIFSIFRISRKYILLTILGLSTTGFFYLNSVFVWPKLIAASLAVFGIFILINAKGASLYKLMPVAVAAIALSLLAHGGIIFTLAPAFLYVLYKIFRNKKYFNLKLVASSVLVGLLILIPWQIYKNSMSGTDRLTKYHLADIRKAEDQRPIQNIILDEYRKLTFEEWKDRKIKNIQTLVTGNYKINESCPFGASTLLKECAHSQWRAITFFSTLFALEVFILGIFVLAYRALRKKLDEFDKASVFIIAGSFLFWVMAMFAGGSTIVHQGSYATMLLLFIILARHLIKYPFVFGPLVGLQIIIFSLVWLNY